MTAQHDARRVTNGLYGKVPRATVGALQGHALKP